MDPKTKRTIIVLVVIALLGAFALWMAGRALDDVVRRQREGSAASPRTTTR